MKMKVLIILSVVFLFSCTREDEDKFPANPDWLTDKIAQMDTVDYYFGTAVYLYEWQNAFYYYISIPLSSCMMCEFYNYDGVKFSWTQDKSEDFQKNAMRKKIVWQRNRI